MDNSEYDPNFPPQLRSRSNTWPSNRQEQQYETFPHHQTLETTCEEFNSGSFTTLNTLIPLTTESHNNILLEQDESDHQDDLSPQSQIKKNSSRRNAWGNLSYADLITRAIQESPEKRLTLSQIYEWMVQHVDYFKDKGDSNSSAGWKNSIRHNLSLHNRFIRIQNDGAGKSSWWMINPDAKTGKIARRRASSMDPKAYEKKKGRLRKKDLRQSMLASSLPGGNNNLLEQTPSPGSEENLDEFGEARLQVHPQNQLHTHHTQSPHNNSPIYSMNGLQNSQAQSQAQQSIYSNGNNCLLGQMNSPDHQFRTRTTSNASSCGRFSPLDEHHGVANSLSPLTNWTQNSSNGYTLDMDAYPNELSEFSSLSIEPNLTVQQQNNQVNGYNNGQANYMNNNLLINNPMYTDESNNRNNYLNRANQIKLNKSNIMNTT